MAHLSKLGRASTRRQFLLASAALCAQGAEAASPLREFGYGDVDLAPGLAQTQFDQTQSVLLGLNEDSLLKPWRLRAGLPAPGPDLGGWYDEVPLVKTESGGHGFAPAHCFGQWLSALARGYAVNRDARTRAKLERLLGMYGPAISGRFYTNFRFPAYNYDKMLIGLLDAHRFAGLPNAMDLLQRTTDAAVPHLPPRALDRDDPQKRWRASVGEYTGNDYTWDESYTLAENLFLASDHGAGARYRPLAERFLLNQTFFDPLSEGQNVLGGHHAYSFFNALCSAMQAYLSTGSAKHLRAASNAFDMIQATQSFATGGWGPNESFSAPGSGELYASLAGTHRGFETPCGSYAHCKLTRGLLRVTRDGRYGDSMERVLYNTVLGAKPLQADGRAFYYSDYHAGARKTYFNDAWPCCSGTLPQVAADYRLLVYFRDPAGVWVNLYLPSTVRWTSADGVQMALTQSGDYPAGGRVAMRLKASRASSFALRLRIPAWSRGAVIRVNGAPVRPAVENGFVSLQRAWKDGDRVDLDLHMPTRLEAIDAAHPDVVALVKGPLVLFPIGGNPPVLKKEQLAAASSGALFRPFTEIHDEPYSTYFRVS
jgi:DUF1680 family protein